MYPCSSYIVHFNMCDHFSYPEGLEASYFFALNFWLWNEKINKNK